jgi:hypothetical protein
VLSQEVILRSPAEFSCYIPWDHYCKLLVGEVSAEEEQEIICLLVMPGGINPSVNHGHLTHIIFGIEYGDRLNPVSIIVVPVIPGVPAVIVAVHVPGPEDIAISGVVEYPVAVYISIMVIVNMHFSGRVGIVV